MYRQGVNQAVIGFSLHRTNTRTKMLQSVEKLVLITSHILHVCSLYYCFKLLFTCFKLTGYLLKSTNNIPNKVNSTFVNLKKLKFFKH